MDFFTQTKQIINSVLLALGLGMTFLGDFTHCSKLFIESYVAKLLFIDMSNISVENMTKIDLGISWIMRVIVGFGTLAILYHVKNKKKKDNEK